MGKQVIEGKRLTAFSLLPRELKIITDPAHPLYDPRVEKPLTPAFIAGIRRFGLRGQTVAVQKDGPDTVVVFGRRRVRAVEVINKEQEAAGVPEDQWMRVPCMVTHGDEKEMFALQVIENEQREDDAPLDKAKKLQRLLAMGYNEDDAAIIFGLSRPSIDNLVAILNLDSSVKEEIEKGEISASAAIPFSALPRAEQREAVKEAVAAGATSRSKVERRLAGKKTSKTKLTSVSKGRLRRLLKINAKAKLLDGPAALLLEWVLGEAEDDDMTRVKGFTALLRAEAEKADLRMVKA